MRNADPSGPTWRVLAGDVDNPTLLGFATPGYTYTGNRSRNRWKAIAVGGWVLRDDATSRKHAVGILLHSHQRVAGVQRKFFS